MTAPELLTDLTRRGFTVRGANGALVVTPASALTATDREAIRAARAELLLLTAGEVWDGGTASRLMYDADALVGDLGVSGWHPAVQDAAATVVRAHATENMEELRRGVSAFVAAIRALAACPTAETRAG